MRVNMDTSTTQPAPDERSIATMTESEVRTFTGRSLDEILPRVRAELGPDAIVVRRREGLAGGVAGFFQRPFAEVEARPPLPDEDTVGGESALRNDRATAEGLASPAIQALVEQATPFADALARAEVSVGDRAEEILLAASQDPVAAGLYRPPPNLHPASPEPDEIVAPEPVAAPAPRDLGPVRPAA